MQLKIFARNLCGLTPCLPAIPPHPDSLFLLILSQEWNADNFLENFAKQSSSCDLEQRQFIIRFTKLWRESFNEWKQRSITRKYCFIQNW